MERGLSWLLSWLLFFGGALVVTWFFPYPGIPVPALRPFVSSETVFILEWFGFTLILSWNLWLLIAALGSESEWERYPSRRYSDGLVLATRIAGTLSYLGALVLLSALPLWQSDHHNYLTLLGGLVLLACGNVAVALASLRAEDRSDPFTFRQRVL